MNKSAGDKGGAPPQRSGNDSPIPDSAGSGGADGAGGAAGGAAAANANKVQQALEDGIGRSLAKIRAGARSRTASASSTSSQKRMTDFINSPRRRQGAQQQQQNKQQQAQQQGQQQPQQQVQQQAQQQPHPPQQQLPQQVQQQPPQQQQQTPPESAPGGNEGGSLLGLNIATASSEDLRGILATVAQKLGMPPPPVPPPGLFDWQTQTRGGRRPKDPVQPGQDQRSYRRSDDRRGTFQIPGGLGPASNSGYHSTTADRNRARWQARGSTAAAALTTEQWAWFAANRCIGCGKPHHARDCPALTAEEGKALVKAAISCPPDMRPGTSRGPQQQQQQYQAVRQQQQRDRQRHRHLQTLQRQGPRPVAATASATSAAEAVAQAASAATASVGRVPPPPTGPPAPQPGGKRGREGTAGLTPEAKKARNTMAEQRLYAEAVRKSLTLYVRKKDGQPMDQSEFMDLRGQFTAWSTSLLEKGEDAPLCELWQFSTAVVRIPMMEDEGYNAVKDKLLRDYLVQTEMEWRESQGKLYVAHLKTRLEPDLTKMRRDGLELYVRAFKRKHNVEGLFHLKRAAPTKRGLSVHLAMDNEAEAVFVASGCKIPFAASGYITFEERSVYLARIRALDKAKRGVQQIQQQVPLINLDSSDEQEKTDWAQQVEQEEVQQQQQQLAAGGPSASGNVSPAHEEEMEHARQLENDQQVLEQDDNAQAGAEEDPEDLAMQVEHLENDSAT